MNFLSHKTNLFFVSLFYLFCLFYSLNSISISIYEINKLDDLNFLIKLITDFFINIFGKNDFSIRFIFIILHILDIVLIYLISRKICPKYEIYACLIFIFMPGVFASSMIIDNASLMIFYSLLLVFLYKYDYKIAFYVFLGLFSLINQSMLFLLFGLCLYSLFYKKKYFLIYCIVLLCLCFYNFNFDFSGRPKNYFIDNIAIVAISMSPIVFLYYFYTIYRIGFKEQKDILWFISASNFALLVVISMRQQINTEDFLPLFLISSPLLVRTFLNSYLVRLKKFRLKYKILLRFSLVFLFASFLLLVFSNVFYLFLNEPKNHFAYNYNFAKELANKLKEKDILEVKTDYKMQKRLEFYGIKKGGNFLYKSKNCKDNEVLIDLKYEKYCYRK